LNDPPTRDAIFLVVTAGRTPAAVTAVRQLLADLSKLVRAVGARDLNGRLSCVVAIGADGWESIVGLPRPSLLHRFMPVVSDPRRSSCSNRSDPTATDGEFRPAPDRLTLP
jgi:hypothetical protein